MARTLLTVLDLVDEGVTESPTAAFVDGHMFPNDQEGKTFIHIINGGAGALNLTIQTPATVAGLAVAEQVVNVPAGTEKFIGKLNWDVYTQTDGNVYIDYDTLTSVTVQVMKA